MIFDKSVKAIDEKKDNLFNKWGWDNMPKKKKMDLDSFRSNQRLASRTYRQFLKHNNKEISNLIKILTQNLNRHLPVEDTEMAHKHMKRCSTPLVIREQPN